MQEYPPTNPTPPYGPVSLLPDRTSFRSIGLVSTFPPPTPDAQPIPVGTSVVLTLTWQQTGNRPSISFPAEPNHNGATYTLIMTDPDAPTPHDTKYSYWRHWIQPGLHPSSAPGTEAKSNRDPLTSFLAPGQKEPSADPHRYLFLLYREPPSPDHPYYSLTQSDVGGEGFEARRAFDFKTWVDKYELEPVAFVWFWGSG